MKIKHFYVHFCGRTPTYITITTTCIPSSYHSQFITQNSRLHLNLNFKSVSPVKATHDRFVGLWWFFFLYCCIQIERFISLRSHLRLRSPMVKYNPVDKTLTEKEGKAEIFRHFEKERLKNLHNDTDGLFYRWFYLTS